MVKHVSKRFPDPPLTPDLLPGSDPDMHRRTSIAYQTNGRYRRAYAELIRIAQGITAPLPANWELPRGIEQRVLTAIEARGRTAEQAREEVFCIAEAAANTHRGRQLVRELQAILAAIPAEETA